LSAGAAGRGSKLASPTTWKVYLLRCADGTLYCGITRDVKARIAAHDAGRGARYTRGRGPVALLVTRRCRDMGTALRLEHAIKRLPRLRKLALADNPEVLKSIARAVARQKPYMS
jgi:putative endonuclease